MTLPTRPNATSQAHLQGTQSQHTANPPRLTELSSTSAQHFSKKTTINSPQYFDSHLKLKNTKTIFATTLQLFEQIKAT